MIAQNVSRALIENFDKIRNELGPEGWSRFYQEIAPLLEHFDGITEHRALELAADPVWQVCRRYPFIKDLVLGYSPQDRRRPEAGGTGYEDEEPISDIANRFQTLLAKLKEIALPDEEIINQSGAQDANRD
ncbi:MAG: hypothetical protein KJ077_25930 [Anaerolineae bacterium]|nr:hypothetical protein [Anaerolineae bacterium]